ncbi:hypothetical protein TIFTF001_011010 [Ficus carica]|uniref:Uncharacterized protein n=1 Tax=Ficus carica TaxID=3494 RepID=A0AA87ZSP9_FICCA|nr:hypothetical protein TIFTF001_011010 [Ficus carica]
MDICNRQSEINGKAWSRLRSDSSNSFLASSPPPMPSMLQCWPSPFKSLATTIRSNGFDREAVCQQSLSDHKIHDSTDKISKC